MKFNILIVDDETNIREGLGQSLEMDGYAVFLAAGGQEALRVFGEVEIDLVITDLKMPQLSGEELLRRIVADEPTIPVIVLTGHGSIETAVGAMRDGAYDFITKPVNLDHLSIVVRRALASRNMTLQYRELQSQLEKKRGFANIIGTSPRLARAFAVAEQVAASRAAVLLTGESGTGKELFANAIHNLSNRRDKAFVKVHCAALAESLLESELFGHEKGSFTGALSRKRGRFELAHLGTIFLDEIGEINPVVQVKILRVLQEKKFERVGGEETLEVDARVIAATNRDLKKEIAEGRFRDDLFYRLNVVNIHLPPLRECKEDIPLLVAAFLKEFSIENKKNIEGIEPKALSALYTYSWPGNIRELRNCIESALVLCKDRVIGVDDLPPSVGGSAEENSVRIALGTSMADAEKQIILGTLGHVRGNKSRAADVLDISRKTLHRKLKDYGIKEEDHES
ncbi:MAG: sigma-54 dependent transcriptional regulator [Spirochaetaceae bacterium]|nr:sigma-54 dependent transcriptional regulator [Spirochaetaceae bacterium]